MNKLDRQLAQIFKRCGGNSDGIENMPEDYKDGWYVGDVAGREAQRTADIALVKEMFENNGLSFNSH